MKRPSRLPPQLLATIEIGHVHDIGAGPRGVWLANYEEGTISLVDADRNAVTEEIHVADELGSGPSGILGADERLWLIAADSGTIGLFDPESSEVTDVARVGRRIIDVAATDTAIWLAQTSGRKSTPDQALGGVPIRSANIELPPPGQRYAIYSDIAAGDAGVWALDESQGTLAAIAPSTGPAHIAALHEPAFTGAQADVAVGHGYVWVETSSDTTSSLARFDPGTGEILSVDLDGQDGSISVGHEDLWVLTRDEEQGWLWRIDPDAPTSPSGPFVLEGEYSSANIAFSSGSIWVTHDTNLLTRMDITGRNLPDGPIPSPERRGDADICGNSGPWTYCPQANWLRRVMVAAGFEVKGDTGTALEVDTPTRRLYAWNTLAIAPVEEVARAEGYERLGTSDAYSDGQRLLWEAQELHIYLSAADDEPIDALPVEEIARAINASLIVAMSADLSGAKPQPSPTGQPQTEETGDGRIRIWPVTEDVQNEGKYLFDAPHCGLDWMLDFDASFWRVIEPPDYGDGENYSFLYNSDQGTITFSDENSAIYQASTGEEVEIERLKGPIIIDPCA